MNIINHTQLLNVLIEKYGYKSYLEIGVQNPANNFNFINCYFKYGVDPNLLGYYFANMTSDDFFKLIIEGRYIYYVSGKHKDEEYKKFDLIFIDGDHTKDQVKRDFENSLKCLSENGRIVIHDTLPKNESGTLVPRKTRQWWGTVYQFVMTLAEYSGIYFRTLNIDNGCTIIWKDESKKGGNAKLDQIGWPEYVAYGRILMRVTNEIEI